jgi:hypothetical protein
MNSNLKPILSEIEGKTIYRVEITVIDGPNARIQDRAGGILCEGSDEPAILQFTPSQPQKTACGDPLLIFKNGGTTLSIPIPNDAKFLPNTFGGGGGNEIPDCLMASLIIRSSNTLVHIEYI